jgi:glycosyltransferase involved in cell wall biosynthesis
MSDILVLATASIKPNRRADTEHVEYPRVDYEELKQHLDVDVFDYSMYDQSPAGPVLRTVETHLRSDLYLTLLGLLARRRYRLVFAMSERVGIPFAGLHPFLPGRVPFVSMFTCWSWRQEALITRLGLFANMDSILVHNRAMKDHFVKLGVRPERLHIVPYSVDQRFFSPMPEVPQRPGFILSLGEIRSRDYQLLFQAVDGLPLQLLVAASGSWYAREKKRNISTTVVPDNVLVSGGFSPVTLRTLYAQAQFVVLPVYDSVFSAGATAVLESMCMGRAVIATRSRGLRDFVIDGETGILVDPGDIHGMREAIRYLLAHPEKARQMGENGRHRVEQELNLDVYVKRIANLLREQLKTPQASPVA